MSADAQRVQRVRRALEDRGYAAANLRPVGTRPSLSQYLRDLWLRRHFIWEDSRHRVAVQNAGNRLGSGWLILRPLLDALFFFVIFGVVLGVGERGDVRNYPAFIVIGVLLFSSTSRSMSNGPATIRQAQAMIRAFSFPRASVPLAVEIRGVMQSIPAVAVMLLMIVVIPPHETPATTWLLLIPALLLQWILNLGLRLLLARVGFHFPDATQMMSFVTRVLMYGSGVIFPINRFVEHPEASLVIQANPVFQFLTIARTLLMDGQLPPTQAWVILSAWSFGLLLVGFVTFWFGEAKYGGSER